ncbi:MAG TPA: OsmC family protein [Candidatus Rikenella faecigallinarum]|uniref:OsmC family protein n=1 Tax=Candidatus Rikenella faecigallinarum TaxID=2838745 RepID=A0A9D1QD09_9BACT|nr:OsmC family protein [Candidatus Rikenella faecigallinarum]
MENVKLEWKGGMQFDAQVDGHTITLDAPETLGGMNVGARPKPLLLVALAGCTGMDVASLARKMRVEYDRLEIDVEAEKTDEMPVVYRSMTLRYRFEGQGIDPSKPLKMVSLSQERYCGVSAMLRQVCPVAVEVYLNGERIG